jgi:ankyrin repeat protein
MAAYKGQDDNVEILLKHKADPNIRDLYESNTKIPNYFFFLSKTLLQN